MRLILALLALGCGPARRAVLSVTPGVPPVEQTDAAPYSTRCRGAVAEVLASDGRWWPSSPAGAACPCGCEVIPGEGASCAPCQPDGGVQ